MSEIRVDKVIDEAGTGAVELTQGATLPAGKTISGSGTIAVNSSGTAAGLTGTPDIAVRNITGVGMTLTGVLTYEDVTNVDSVGLITARTGIEVVGFVTAKTGSAVTFSGGANITNAVETVNTGSYATGADPVSGITTGILTLNARLGTVFTHDVASNKAVGVVSITNFPVLKNSFHTITVIFNQDGAGTANSTTAAGIGTNITLTPEGVAGFNTEGLVGSGTSVSLSTTAEDIDVVTFGIHYNGGTNTDATNYRTFVTKNGGFRFG